MKWTAEDLLIRGDRAFARRRGALILWQAQAEIFYPERADFTVSPTAGDERYWDIFEEEPMLLRRDLANQIGAMIRPRGKDWFKAKAFPRQINDNENVRFWCESASEIQRDVIYASGANFTRAMSQSDNDYVAFGESIGTHTYNEDRTGLSFTCGHPRDYAYYENANGIVDEMHERMAGLTMAHVRQMGFVLPADWKERFEKDPHTEVEVRRCVYPVARYLDDREEGYNIRKGGPPGIPRDARFAVMYLATDCRQELKTESGKKPFFRTWPYFVRRWMNVSGEPFGRSPCTSVALATGRTLNQAGISILESLEKGVNPPLVAPDDAIVGEVQIKANGVTFYDPSLYTATRSPVEALPVGEPRNGMEYTAERRMFLARAFLQNQIRFPDTNGRTATEARLLWEQFTREAAPVFEPMEAENAQLMEGVFERIFDAAGPGKSGGFPEPPEELYGAEVKFEFETPLSEAYRRLKLEKAQEANAYMAERVALNPGVVDLVDQDEMDKEALESILPQKALRKAEDVAASRQAKAQQQQLMQAANVALQLAGAKGKPGAAGGMPGADGPLPAPDAIAGALAGA